MVRGEVGIGDVGRATGGIAIGGGVLAHFHDGSLTTRAVGGREGDSVVLGDNKLKILFFFFGEDSNCCV